MTSTVTYPKLGECKTQAEQIARVHIWYMANINNPVKFVKSDTDMWFWTIGEGQFNGASMKRKDCKAHYEAFKAKAEALA